MAQQPRMGHDLPQNSIPCRPVLGQSFRIIPDSSSRCLIPSIQTCKLKWAFVPSSEGWIENLIVARF
ncbi:hypothetical protein CEXT_218541 [Caerostris extrusa]|uniref:Uncharacterized protein n=1 Tax=Caerostris extrusa TaxID=172846 RepID=A0AAV4TH14_CAEEX|nr:hypothetical protein CEXT_218541 [Caerostris extrusa]